MSLQVRTGFLPLTVSFLLAGAIASCGGGGSSGGGGGGAAMYIDTCSLGCSNGASSSLVSCAIGQHSRNGDVTIFFSEPVLASTVTPSSFQLIDVSTGQSPIGVRFVDSTDPSGKKMIFRPAVFFDANGNTIFGFNAGTTYRVTLPGTLHGDLGPFVSSTTGSLNQSRMQCDFVTTNQIEDLVSGPPRVTVLVQPAVNGDPTQGGPLQSADGLVNVWRNSPIVMRFNDVMNPATLLNPTTHQLTQITVMVDTDGVAADQVPLFGQAVLNIDLIALRTDVTFTPANGMPSGTALSGSARHIVVMIPNTVTDLVGNGVANPGNFIFQPESVPEPATTLPDADGEGFTNTANEDTAASGADWSNGRLTRGFGGGSGRLGELRVPTLQSVTLDCDGTEIRNVSVPDSSSNFTVVKTSGVLDNSHPSASPAAPNEYATTPTSWPTVVVTDGIFEFSSLNLDTGSTLLIHGTTHPARLFSRGPVNILGTIDIRGGSPPEHDSEQAHGDPGGAGGPSGGHGGAGGDRWDNPPGSQLSDPTQVVPTGIPNQGAIISGRNGVGLGGSGTRGVGIGADANPDPGPNQTCMSPDPAFLLGLLLSDPGNQPNGDPGFCTVRQVASPGGGGAYATSGTDGVPLSSVPFGIDPVTSQPVSNLPAVIAHGGNAATLGIEPPDPESGHRVRKLAGANLRGGTGGGGGGGQLFDTGEDVNPFPFGYCYDTDDTCQAFIVLTHYSDHSAAGGGGGGGALQLASGEQIHLDGSIRANGGDGGSSMFSTLVIPGFNGPRKSRACPGGAGSGGAVRLQAQLLDIFARDPNDPHDAPRIDVTGGAGGTWSSSYPLTPTPPWQITLLGKGGDGGAGLMRLEDMSGGTNPPTTLMTRCSEAPKLAPYDATNDPCGKTSLSVGPWDLSIFRPETFSGASSCWMKASGNYFELGFVPDDLAHNPPVYGWNMDVVFHDLASGQDVLTPYRGRDANTPFPTGDFESNLGTDVNYLDAANPPGNQFGTGVFDPSRFGTYMAVRFQGAVADLDTVGRTPCSIVLVGPSAQIQPGSLTPWVSHPAELNEFRPRPNIVRFCVVFDRSLALAAGVNSQINGVTNLKIQVQPN